MRECPGIPRESEPGVESTRNRSRSRVRHCAQEGDARLQSVWSVWSVFCKRATGSRACGDVVAAPIGWGASVVTSEVRDARFGGLVVLRWSSGMSALQLVTRFARRRRGSAGLPCTDRIGSLDRPAVGRPRAPTQLAMHGAQSEPRGVRLSPVTCRIPFVAP